MNEAPSVPGAAPVAGIVVVSFNTRRFLARQCAALAAQTEKRWRLVLVDNASRPEERPSAADLPEGAVLIQSEQNLGFAAANNRAVAALDTPLVAFLNPDAFPEPDWLARLLDAAARHPEADAFGSTQLSDDGDALLDGAGDELTAFGFPYRALHRKPRARNRSEGEAFSACAAAALYRTSAFRALGGFDEALFAYGEDVDLGYRLRLAGGKTIQAPEAVVRHLGGGSASSRDFAEYHGARNRLWVFCKDTPAPLLIVMALPHLLATLAVLALRLRDSRGPPAWRGFIDGVKGIGPIWRLRRAIQAARKATTLDVARRMIWAPWAFAARAPKRPI